MRQDNSKLNASGCKDPVAYEAIRSICKEENDCDRKATELIRVLKRFIRGCGYEPISRIAIKDTKTGKEYR